MNGDCTDVDVDDNISDKHRREKKELQVKIIQLKKAVTKNDKKRKKEVSAEIAVLEAELEARHLSETAQYGVNNGYSDSVDCQAPTEETDASGSAQKATRAAKRRDKKDAKSKAMLNAELQDKKSRETSSRTMELETIVEKLRSRHLVLHQIASDGDCLYNAISHQLGLVENHFDMLIVRQKAARVLRENAADFAPFLVDPNTGDMLSEEEYDVYCSKVEKPTMWGGQPEIRAASIAFQKPIEVIQADSSSLMIGEEFSTPPLVITYHKHMYRLGEHYNSTKPLLVDDNL